WVSVFGDGVNNGTRGRPCTGFTFITADLKWKLLCPYEVILSPDTTPMKSNGKFHGFCKACCVLQNNIRGNPA
ncbi:hypothetical protein HDU80_001063, partial [Chytriomyces hyalinus]